jgi:hypothetical protein
MALVRENMGMYFLEDDYPLQKNSYKYADIKEAILLRDKLNEVIDKYSQSDIDEANKQLMEEVYAESYAQSNKIQVPSIGYVYLLLGENGKYKIGKSKNPENRCKQLCLSSCENHKLIYSFKCLSPHKQEQSLHEMFNEKKSHSEWFNLSKSDVEYIKELEDEV